jgi:hypothetical protein
MTTSEQTTATTEGPPWSAASGWFQYRARFAAPAPEAVARAAGIEGGAAVLDLARGSGETMVIGGAPRTLGGGGNYLIPSHLPRQWLVPMASPGGPVRPRARGLGARAALDPHLGAWPS